MQAFRMRLWKLRVAIVGLLGSAMFASAAGAGTPWLRFDVPDSPSTQPFAINSHNPVVGQCQNPTTFYACAFLRTRDGTFTTFDAPDATQGTTAFGVNDAGDITGSFTFFSGKQFTRGYVRHMDGTFEEFQANGLRWTIPAAINDAGTIVGRAKGDATPPLAFLRKADGTTEVFLRNTDGSYASGINRAGAITGYYMRSYVMHGFLRGTAGKITTFDPPDSVNTQPASINNSGQIAGFYSGQDYVSHGFLRESDGTITTFDAPGAAGGTVPTIVDTDGDVAGYYYDDTNTSHGFIRDHAGQFHRVDVQGHNSMAVTAIGPSGKLVGYDADGHGFRLFPYAWRRH